MRTWPLPRQCECRLEDCWALTRPAIRSPCVRAQAYRAGGRWEGVTIVATRFGFVSTYPPTACGLATFTAALFDALTLSGSDEGRVARLLDGPPTPGGAEVVSDIVLGDPAGSARAATSLSDCDVVIVQHEFGVYGGPDGQDVLTLLADVTVPTIVVLHTVLAEPTTHQRQVLEAVVGAASAVVTMTRAARDRLLAGYRVDAGKVSIIAHGAPDSAIRVRVRPPSRPRSLAEARPTVLTWGLLGPGKGIEWAIQAMARLRDIQPAPQYIVAGRTHPKVALREGETYRDGLSSLVRQLSLADAVSLDARYRDAASLADLVASADVVLLPYDSTDQVTSGCPDRGRRRRQTRCRDAIPARGRTALRRGRRGSPPSGPRLDRRRAPTGDHPARRRGRDVEPPRRGSHRRCDGPAVADQYRGLAARLIADAADAAA